MTTLQHSKTRRHGSAPKENDAMRILVATAGDADSIGALWVASALAAERGAKVLALGVTPPFPHTFPSMFRVKTPLAIDEESRLRMLEDVREFIHDIPGASEWNKSALVGWPADAIAAAAASWNASLVVIGLGRHEAIDRLFGTETAVAVIRQSKIPVLAVSAEERSLPKHACVAMDFTAASHAAASLAASLLGRGGTLTLLHACAFDGVESHPGDLVDLYRTGAKAKLDRAVASLRRHKRDVEIRGAMAGGEPAETILKVANDQGSDLIALGGHKQGLMDRVLLGSVRTRVLRSARCSVLIAPPNPADATAWREGK